MAAGAALSRDGAPGFSIGPLTTYADPAAMAEWVEQAGAGHELIYATGPQLGDHAAKALALHWQEQGLVALKQRRSSRAHCFDYLAERVGAVAPAPTTSASDGHVRGEMAALLRILRRCAVRGKVCPSNAELAKELGLRRGEASRRRSRYLLERLAQEKRISVTGCGRNAPRVVTILAAGKACGKSTAGEAA